MKIHYKDHIGKMLSMVYQNTYDRCLNKNHLNYLTTAKSTYSDPHKIPDSVGFRIGKRNFKTPYHY